MKYIFFPVQEKLLEINLEKCSSIVLEMKSVKGCCAKYWAISKNHRMSGTGRDLQRSSSPIPHGLDWDVLMGPQCPHCHLDLGLTISVALCIR